MKLSVLCCAAAMFGTGADAAPVKAVRGGPSIDETNHAPAKVLDGDPATEWVGKAGVEKWELCFDLGTARHIDHVRADFSSALETAREVTGEISSDGRHWQPLGAFPNGSPTTLHVGQPVRFFRLVLEGAIRGNAPHLREVTFHTREAAPGTPASPIREILYPSAADNTLQPARFFPGKGNRPVPLVVGLHTWSGNYRQRYLPAIEKWCVEKGWAYIHPDFRGPNWTPEACGSDLAVEDILSAVRYARHAAVIDPRRIYLVGASGGGHAALLLAGHAPEVWTAVSAWVPISDLAAWYRECRARHSGYADHIVKACGGAPGDSPAVDEELRRRSPLTWLAAARGLPLDINAGIHDGHTGSVPVSHSLRAFNRVAAPADRVAEADIDFMTGQEKIPESLQRPIVDPTYGSHKPLFRRQSGAVRVTLFEGGHQIVEPAALAWLEGQIRPAHRDTAASAP